MADVVDATTHVGPSVYDDFEFEPTLATLREQLDAAGIDAALVSPLKPPSLDFDVANARLADRLADWPALHGLGRIDPRREDAVAHTRTAVADHGFRGIRLHPWEETYDITDAAVEPVVAAAADLGVPVWVHAGYPGVSHALSVRTLAERFPDVTFVLTHGAQLDISGLSLTDALLLAEERPNTVFDLSGVYRRDFIQDLVEAAGTDRVVFGSNAPYFHPAVEKARVTTNDLGDDVTTAVLGGAARFL